MSKIFSLILFSVFLASNADAQNNLPPVYQITTDTTLFDTLENKYWQLLEDKDGRYSFDEITKPRLSNEFHFNKEKTLWRNYNVHGYWIRFTLKNIMDHPAEICLGDSTTFHNDYSDFYLVETIGEIIHYRNGGGLTPWSQKDGIKAYGLIPVEIRAGETIIIYRRIYNSYQFYSYPLYRFPIAVGFGSKEKQMERIYQSSQVQYINAIHDVFIAGILIFASLFIFFFFLNIREKVYLYFSFYLFTLGIGRFSTNGEIYDALFREYPVILYYITDLWWPLIHFFLVLFIRHLLHLRDYHAKFDKVLQLLNILVLLNLSLANISKFLGLASPTFVGISVTLGIILTALLLFCIPLAFFLAYEAVKKNKVLLFLVLPLQSIWCVLRGILEITDYSSRYKWSLYRFQLFAELNKAWYGLETVLLSSLVVSFSWVLLKRYGELKKQIVQKELDSEMQRRQLIEEQKNELEKTVEQRTSELRQSFQELKSTQTQLVQQEKMASLGELTAGIAHEIQNPLNFVNNFSEVNKEMLEELIAERLKPKAARDEAAEIDLINNVIVNEEKISQHGKRADAIVKGMLQHSRTSSGQKELTDINALADEYLRLAYHGMRAKDKTFNAEINTEFDSSVGKISVVPQDIGRVILNLINNAFYAVNEKHKENISAYEPAVSVTTVRIDDHVLIRIADNGNGIPQKIIDKIFQPFFTTKPTGQGTGLGLSLAYDIVKAHGGEIKVENLPAVQVGKGNEGTEFIVQLPFN